MATNTMIGPTDEELALAAFRGILKLEAEAQMKSAVDFARTYMTPGITSPANLSDLDRRVHACEVGQFADAIHNITPPPNLPHVDRMDVGAAFARLYRAMNEQATTHALLSCDVRQGGARADKHRTEATGLLIQADAVLRVAAEADQARHAMGAVALLYRAEQYVRENVPALAQWPFLLLPSTNQGQA